MKIEKQFTFSFIRVTMNINSINELNNLPDNYCYSKYGGLSIRRKL